MLRKKQPEVIISGAGPIGMVAGLALRQHGVAIRIFDRDYRPGTHSYALALHPQTLELLENFGVVDRIISRACRVRSIGFYEGAQRKATIALDECGCNYPFVAVIRQSELETVLAERLAEYHAPVSWSHRVSRVEAGADRIETSIDRLERHMMGYACARLDWVVDKRIKSSAPFLIAADGHNSFTRKTQAIPFPTVGETQQFAVFEFQTDGEDADEMRIVINEDSTNVVWPLPGNHCRWSFEMPQVDAPEDSRVKDQLLVQVGDGAFPLLTEELLRRLIKDRAPWFTGSIKRIEWRMAVRFEKRLAETFRSGRICLAGDSAHLTGPVGIQSMNVGMREACDLSARLASILKGEDDLHGLDDYNRQRLEEWRFLLGLEGQLKPLETAEPWIAAHKDRILSCLPASGEALRRAAAQIGLEVCPEQFQRHAAR